MASSVMSRKGRKDDPEQDAPAVDYGDRLRQKVEMAGRAPEVIGGAIGGGAANLLEAGKGMLGAVGGAYGAAGDVVGRMASSAKEEYEKNAPKTRPTATATPAGPNDYGGVSMTETMRPNMRVENGQPPGGAQVTPAAPSAPAAESPFKVAEQYGSTKVYQTGNAFSDRPGFDGKQKPATLAGTDANGNPFSAQNLPAGFAPPAIGFRGNEDATQAALAQSIARDEQEKLAERLRYSPGQEPQTYLSDLAVKNAATGASAALARGDNEGAFLEMMRGKAALAKQAQAEADFGQRSREMLAAQEGARRDQGVDARDRFAAKLAQDAAVQKAKIDAKDKADGRKFDAMKMFEELKQKDRAAQVDAAGKAIGGGDGMADPRFKLAVLGEAQAPNQGGYQIGQAVTVNGKVRYYVGPSNGTWSDTYPDWLPPQPK